MRRIVRRVLLVLAALATLPASAQPQLKIFGYFQNTFSHQTQLKT
ncbi:MAG: hypothetical protein VX948_20515 [Candidatus Latescibacterota bacterium]|nr:hypothetical protein [Candidatus Latescibacterota bacterium]